MKTSSAHQYIDRNSRQIVTEKLVGDRAIALIYSTIRENAPALFRALTSSRMSSLLSLYHFDFLDRKRGSGRALFARLGVDWSECVEECGHYQTPRQVFERQIRYWDLRPMNDDPKIVVSPADARVLIGSFAENSSLFIKEKLFTPAELFGRHSPWQKRFTAGDFAVFRLTPDKYHYNHLPVSGRVEDIYQVDGQYHSCNPAALVALASLHAKNKRVVTIIDTDIPGGSRIGLVAMIEVVALMIGDIVQAYSSKRYLSPCAIEPRMVVEKGCPKSYYRPGSSTDILVFEKNRIAFSRDLVHNSRRNDVSSRFVNTSGRAMVETDLKVRSAIGYRLV
ncbi:MAG: phosphatidylserine decarboxylase [Desulfopila sp.]